jgi:hypothetical protein
MKNKKKLFQIYYYRWVSNTKSGLHVFSEHHYMYEYQTATVTALQKRH